MDESTYEKLRKQQENESRECQAFLASPVWAWLRGHLERSKTKLVRQVTGTCVDELDRHRRLGKLALIVEILERPGDLTTILADLEAAKAQVEASLADVPQYPAVVENLRAL